MGRNAALFEEPDMGQDCAREQAIAERLAAIYKKHSGITPNAVVEDARDPNSPLHKEFEWDDSKAAELYRLERARALIRRFPIVVTTSKVTISSVAYVRDPNKNHNEQGYVSVVQIRSDAERKAASLQSEFARVRSMLARAERLAEVYEMMAEFDAFVANLPNEYGGKAKNRRSA